MTLYYLESSAWVKRYLAEGGSTWVRGLFERQESMACCLLGYAEVSAAIASQQGIRNISADQQSSLRASLLADWHEMLQVPFEADVMHRAAAFAWQYKLRGADAIHLAAADGLKNLLVPHSISLTRGTADVELISAAASHQLAVIDPTKA